MGESEVSSGKVQGLTKSRPRNHFIFAWYITMQEDASTTTELCALQGCGWQCGGWKEYRISQLTQNAMRAQVSVCAHALQLYSTPPTHSPIDNRTYPPDQRAEPCAACERVEADVLMCHQHSKVHATMQADRALNASKDRWRSRGDEE